MGEVVSAYRAEPFDYREARALVEELGVSEPVAITLVRRGHRTPEAARSFLEAEESHPPDAFGSMADVVERVLRAVRDGRRITVHGDFDVDGVCATSILVGALRELGADCDWLIPDRMADGYGLSSANVHRLAERGTSFLITVDCGITSVEEVALAISLGMDVVVTDHHQPGDLLPDCPILHPAVDGYPFEDLCGTGVAWKLATALRGASGAGPPGSHSRGVPGRPTPDAHHDIDLVALATVADVVPLVGENRSIVKRGLEEIRRAKRPGIRALLAAAKCEPTQVDEGDLAFRLAPRINAAGRLYRADAGVELFLTEDEERAAEIAEELGRANAERRDAERRVDSEAEAKRRELPDDLKEAPGLVVAGQGWHPGVIGIVASRLAERHHRPAVVIALDGEGGGRGSGRSIPGFDLLGALQACSEHLTRFGGHRAAAGLELRAEDVEAFRAAFCAHAAEALAPEDLVRTERIDAMVGGAGIGLDLAEEFERLAPFGMGNPGVRLLVPAARLRDVRTMGEGRHARFSLHSGSHRALGVAFGRSSLGVAEEEAVDAAIRLEVNRWNGSVEPRVVLRELYRRDGEGAEGREEAAEWWSRYEDELCRDPAEGESTGTAPDPSADGNGAGRSSIRSASPPAALLAELASCSRGGVLAVVADRERRRSLAGEGIALADRFTLEREPELARGFEHVVLADPPSSSRALQLASLPTEDGGYLHSAWGDAELRIATTALDEHFARRPALVELFRAMRDAGEVGGEDLRALLGGPEERPRLPEAAARCVRVLSEVGLLQGAADRGRGSIGVVSSEGTDLERSEAYRAYGARHQEAIGYLERHRQPERRGPRPRPR